MKKNQGPNPLVNARPGRRKVRSFVLREGRMTPAQRRALDELWPRYGIDHEAGRLDLSALFPRPAPVVVEIGFGDGEALAYAAGEQGDLNFIGIEVHRPGVGSMLQRIEAQGLDNVRLLCADASEALDRHFDEGSLAGVRVYFPDPWPKKRHHKRRLIQPDFVARVRSRLAPGGLFHLATDWAPYAEYMLVVIGADDGYRNLAEAGGSVERPEWRCRTRFERRGERLGHGVTDLLFERVAAKPAT